MNILSGNQIHALDKFTIENKPISSIDLMEESAKAFVKWFVQKFDDSTPIKIFCGLSNNGGDGLAIARLLYQKKYTVEVFILRYSKNCSKDFLVNETRLKKIKGIPVHNITEFQQFLRLNKQSSIIIDAIWGTGLNRNIEGLTKKIILYLNQNNFVIISIDVPSGLLIDKITQYKQVIVTADYTITFEIPKLAFLFPENYKYVGEWIAVPIGLDKKFINQQKTNYKYIILDDILNIIKPRKKYSHKGNYGHALIIAGSYGKIGAAILSAKACLRCGTGLVTVHLPHCGYSIIQRSLPEVMASIDRNEHYFSKVINIEKYNAIGVGPGLGTEKITQKAFINLLKNSSERLLVIDADAINILAKNKSLFKYIPKNMILTPHPKEFERIAGKSKNDEERLQKQINFAKQYKVYLILKGAHTVIACPDGKCYFNSTGNPGMAKAGSGDVLTGILTGLLSQGYSPKESCLIGVYIHGLAGDISAKKKTKTTMIASDIIENLEGAFKKINS